VIEIPVSQTAKTTKAKKLYSWGYADSADSCVYDTPGYTDRRSNK